jgi:hypothetical protein
MRQGRYPIPVRDWFALLKLGVLLHYPEYGVPNPYHQL